MSRRVVFLIALTALAILGAAAVPWNLTGSRLASTVTAHLRDSYGVDFKVNGQSTFALLPTPRVKFEDMSLSFPDHSIRAEGGTLRGELRLLPLLLGRIRLSEIMLSETRITASHEALRAHDWARLLKDGVKAAQARRLIVAASSLRWSDLADGTLDKVNAVVNWAGTSAPLYAVGSASWRGETVMVEQASFHPELLASNRLSPVSLTITSSAGKLAVTGEAQLGSDPQLTGESRIQAVSVRDLTRWSGLQLPFGSLVQALSIQGDFSLNRRRLTWPSVAVTLGSDRLEGTMAVRFDVDRPVVAGTLAAERLDLSGFVRPLMLARTGSGGWSDEAIDLSQVTGSDLDLRLSATSAQLGRLQVEDMAASVLVRPGRIEASIGRADLHEGTLKGRLSLTAQGPSTEFKGTGTFDRMDLAAFLNTIGESRWIRGRAQGQFLIEGAGQTPSELVRQVRGRSAITVTDGELVGIALDDALRRVEKRPLLAFLNWKGGRTPFDQAHIQVQIDNGIGTIMEGRLKAPELLTSLQGRISLTDRTLDLKADVSPAGSPSTTASSAPAIEFAVGGGWDNVVVQPEVRSLIERSGAARPLFGPRNSGTAAPAEAAAQ